MTRQIAVRSHIRNRLREVIAAHGERGETTVVACSALKRKYRRRLSRGVQNVRFVFLEGSFQLIQSRLEARTNHFMPAQLLQSQFEALEPPHSAQAIILHMEDTVEELVEKIVERLPAP